MLKLSKARRVALWVVAVALVALVACFCVEKTCYGIQEEEKDSCESDQGDNGEACIYYPADCTYGPDLCPIPKGTGKCNCGGALEDIPIIQSPDRY